MMSLNDTSKENIYQRTGLSVEEIKNTDFDVLETKLIKPSLIKKRTLKKYQDDTRLLGRGQVYSYLGRILNLDEIDKKLSRI